MPIHDIQTDFLSFENFNLAWNRVLRSQHAENKDRISLRVFATHIDHNLKQIIQEVETETYIPSKASQIYMPKATRTLRTIPVLSIRDRIVYQAIGNLIIQEAFPELSIVANRHVFAHLPQSSDSLFTLTPWKKQFRSFINNYERIWKQGNHWVVEADISSFYASIDHGLLIELIKERWIANGQFLELFQKCLRTWTAHEEGPEFSRGIPEGYETSDILATLFLLPIDEVMVRSYRYLRYVDDIRILTPDLDTASKALVRLDLELKAHALVLQTRKTGVEEIGDLEDEKENLQKKLSQISLLIYLGKNQQDQLKELFFRAWNRIDKFPEAADPAIAFSLYRLDKDTTIRNIAVQLLELLPWRSAIINKYLEQFEQDRQTIQDLISLIRTHKVYAWHVVNCMRTLSKIANPNAYREIALEWISNQNLQWSQRLAAVEALQHDQDSYVPLYTAIRSENNIFVKRSLIVSCSFLAYEMDAQDEVALLIKRALEDENYEIKLLAIWLKQQFHDISWERIKFNGSLGSLQLVIPELATHPVEKPCFIKHQLRAFYEVDIDESLDFNIIFDDYQGAVLDLKKAIPYYYTDPSLYIGLINSFNHRITIALKSLIGSPIPDHEFGNMIQSKDFKSRFPQVCLYFTLCNDIRNQTTGFHPYASALGTWSKSVSFPESNRIHNGLKLAYQEFIDKYQKHLT